MNSWRTEPKSTMPWSVPFLVSFENRDRKAMSARGRASLLSEVKQVERAGIRWLTGEHYQSQRPLSYHAQHLPRDVRWYADPSGVTEIAELRCAGFHVSPGDNALCPGIAAVTARLETDRLRIVKGACPNLLREASLYRYSDDRTDRRSETPVDEHNHALAALRYLVSAIDARQMARLKGKSAASESAAEEAANAKKPEPRGLSLRNELLWRRLV